MLNIGKHRFKIFLGLVAFLSCASLVLSVIALKKSSHTSSRHAQHSHYEKQPPRENKNGIPHLDKHHGKHEMKDQEPKVENDKKMSAPSDAPETNKKIQ